MHEPWPALIAALTDRPPPPRVNWPASKRHIVRCPGGAEAAEVNTSANVDALVLDALSHEPMTHEQLARALGRDPRTLANRLSRLRGQGRVRLVGEGVWDCA